MTLTWDEVCALIEEAKQTFNWHDLTAVMQEVERQTREDILDQLEDWIQQQKSMEDKG